VTAERQPKQGRETAGVIAPPPVIYLGFLGVGFALEGLLPGGDLPVGVQWLGAAVILAGVALMISFELAFKSVGTDANPYRPSTSLATSGPYRFSRNPGYLGMAITYVGIGVGGGCSMDARDARPRHPGDPVRRDPARGAIPRAVVRRGVPELQAYDAALDLK
jgi:protein-S-isoprenylcysteine O-methyltransferase Ste14